MKYALILAVLWLTLTAAARAEPQTPPQNGAPLPGTLRVIDRDWQYFSRLSCDQLAQIISQSREEEQLLKKRQQQCVDQYRAFFPHPVDR